MVPLRPALDGIRAHLELLRQVGDELIIAASVELEEKEIPALRPKVLIFDADNRVVETLVDRIVRDSDGTTTTLRESSLRPPARGA